MSPIQVLPVAEDFLKLKGELSIFNLMFVNIKHLVSLTVENWILENDDEYVAYSMLEGKVELGQWAKSTDRTGRRLIVLRTSMGNVVVYERHANPLIHVFQLRGPQVVMSSPWLRSPADLVKCDLIGLFALNGTGGEVDQILRKNFSLFPLPCRRAD